MIFEAMDRFLNLGGRHFIQSHVTQFADQVSANISIPFERLRRASTAGVFLYPVAEVLGERGASFLTGLCLAELFGLSFYVPAFGGSLKPGFSFRLSLITAFLKVTQGEGPDALAMRSDFTPDSD
jgi:hypothetical protein